jgi:hypothetical protein
VSTILQQKNAPLNRAGRFNIIVKVSPPMDGGDLEGLIIRLSLRFLH